MDKAALSNTSLLDYLKPTTPAKQLAKGWMPQHEQCELSSNCWCALHFKGSMSKERNPDGIHNCMINSLAITDCEKHPRWGPFLKTKSCPCFISKRPGEGCIFGDMRPAKILAVVSLARKLGVTHIVEEGRYGGTRTPPRAPACGQGWNGLARWRHFSRLSLCVRPAGPARAPSATGSISARRAPIVSPMQG